MSHHIDNINYSFHFIITTQNQHMEEKPYTKVLKAEKAEQLTRFDDAMEKINNDFPVTGLILHVPKGSEETAKSKGAERDSNAIWRVGKISLKNCEAYWPTALAKHYKKIVECGLVETK